MKVYIDRNNIHVELIYDSVEIATLLPLDSLKWNTFATDVFMKLGSLLSVRCRHRSVKSSKCVGSWSSKGFHLPAFPANKERKQLWNSTVNRYRWIPRAGSLKLC